MNSPVKDVIKEKDKNKKLQNYKITLSVLKKTLKVPKNKHIDNKNAAIRAKI